MKEVKKKNGFIDILKFIFSLIIAIFHVGYFSENNNMKLFPCGYIFTEFFFLISGYFFATKCYQLDTSNDTTVYLDNIRFLCKKIKRFAPFILVAWIGGLAVKIFFYGGSLSVICKSIWDLLLMRIFGFETYVTNYPVWYISSMLISMFIIYPYLRNYKDKYALYFAPVISLFIYGYLANTYNTLNLVDDFSFISLGMLRGFAGINLGIVCYKASNFIKASYFNPLKTHIFTLIENLCFVIPIIITLFSNETKEFDYQILLMFFVGLCITGSEITISSKIFPTNFSAFLGELSLPIYINQFCVRILVGNTFNKIYTNYILRLVFYLILLTLFSFAEIKILNKIKTYKIKQGKVLC